MRRRTRVVTVCSAALLTLLACTNSASATYWGGSWSWSPPSQFSLPLLCRDYTGADPKISNYVYNAAYEWDQTNAPPDYISQDPNGHSEGTVSLTLVSYFPNGDDGETTIYNTSGYSVGNHNCPSVCGTNNYASATVTLARKNVVYGGGMDYYAPSDVQRVIAHELGHALGLGHNDTCSSIMRHLTYQGTYSPSAYDEYNLNSLYPS